MLNQLLENDMRSNYKNQVLVILALILSFVIIFVFQSPREKHPTVSIPPVEKSQIKPNQPLSSLPLAHLYYYSWYGNEEKDNGYLHWNHQIYTNGEPTYDPKNNDIGASYWPLLGLYSSKDTKVIHQHMKWIQRAGVQVIVLSWWGVNSNDGQITDQQGFSDQTVPLILDIAAQYNIYICFHIEPYPGRSAKSVGENIKYLIDKYGSHAAFYYFQKTPSDFPRPFFYIYDSYQISPNDWASVLHPTTGSLRQQSPKYARSIVTGLLVQSNHAEQLLQGHFDAWYTYFSVDGFVWGSSTANWKAIAIKAKKHGKLFIPSVGPGYDDVRIRPWNPKTFRLRKKGQYYDHMFQKVLEILDFVHCGGAECDDAHVLVGITSFNEWHEGTTIEPAMESKYAPIASPSLCPNERYFNLLTRPGAQTDRTNHISSISTFGKPDPFIYQDYGKDPYFYLDKTAEWISKMTQIESKH